MPFSIELGIKKSLKNKNEIHHSTNYIMNWHGHEVEEALEADKEDVDGDDVVHRRLQSKTWIAVLEKDKVKNVGVGGLENQF